MRNFEATGRYSEHRYIRNHTAALSGESLTFLDGRRLGDVEPADESPATFRKVRRILEKRVSQHYWATANESKKRGNYARFETRHRLSNQVRNIFGNAAPAHRECA